ncbi:MAG TPA: hypothetical protein VMG10_19760 [Gemmataceae bacterium]|nr:hypothetical protein [Gemmataceae bacterium]
MRWPWQPKHTFRSGLLRIIEGLENGSIVLAPRQGSAGKPGAVAPADLVRTFPEFLDTTDRFIRGMRRVEVEMLLGVLVLWLVGGGALIGGIVWHFRTILLILNGILPFAVSIRVVMLWQKARYHRIRGELLVAILRATPEEERPWQFLRLYPQFKEDLQKAGVQVNPVLQNVQRVFGGWKVTPPISSLSN